ncbi:MAG: hypothetical protein LKM30_07450 [Bacilli bacterium]|jgi:hypothetical protein|nr:hypothetical protein [Bacilli bacterium]
MNDQAKKYVKVSLTLGIIASVSAGLIGLVNALTAPLIQANSLKAERTALLAIYGGTTDDYADVDISGLTAKPSYVQKVWTYSDGNYVAKAYGKNGYGTITLVVGISKDGSLGKMSLIDDTETYKNKLEPNYVDVYNTANNKDSALADVKCGATFGATLIKNMVSEAKTVVVSLTGTSTASQALSSLGGVLHD